MLWESLERWAISAPKRRALDLGAGEGQISAWLAERGFDVLAVEADAEAARALAAADSRLRVEQADLLDIPLEADAYSLIVASSVLHFLLPSDLWGLADRLRAALRPGGLLIAEVLTTDDPGFGARLESGAPALEPNAFRLENGGVLHYFEPGELRRVFASLEAVEYAEERRVDPAADPGYRAGATLVARRSSAA